MEGIRRIETVRRHAPTDPDELWQLLGGFGCSVVQGNCRYRQQATDVHHLNFPRADYTEPLEHAYRTHPDQQIDLCRCKHERVHKTWQASDKPSEDFMIGWLIGQGGISDKVRKIINETRKKRR
jgi:hypothetical protein